MKVHLIRLHSGKIDMWEDGAIRMANPNDDYLGVVDLPIVAPKKTVVKKAEITNVEKGFTMFHFRFSVPAMASNVKCTYEVEE
jgi:hypothetical protein